MLHHPALARKRKAWKVSLAHGQQYLMRRGETGHTELPEKKNTGRRYVAIEEGISDARGNLDIFLARDAEHGTQVFPRTRAAGGW